MSDRIHQDYPMEYLSSTKTLVLPKLDHPVSQGLGYDYQPKVVRRNLKLHTTGRKENDRKLTPTKLVASLHRAEHHSFQPIGRNPGKHHTVKVVPTVGLPRQHHVIADEETDHRHLYYSRRREQIIGPTSVQPAKTGNRVLRPMPRLPAPTKPTGSSGSPKIKISMNIFKQDHLGSQKDVSTVASTKQQMQIHQRMISTKYTQEKETTESKQVQRSGQAEPARETQPIIVVRRPAKIRTEPVATALESLGTDSPNPKPVKSIFSRIHKAEKNSDGDDSGKEHTIARQSIDEILQEPFANGEQLDFLEDDPSKLLASPEENSAVSARQPVTSQGPAGHRHRGKHKTAFVVRQPTESTTQLPQVGQSVSRPLLFQRESSVPDLLVSTTGRPNASSFVIADPNRLAVERPSRNNSHSPAVSHTDVGESRHLYASFKKRIRDTEANNLREEILRRRAVAEVRWNINSDEGSDVLKQEGLKLGFKMGKGAFGEVFEGYDEVLKQQIAIKVIDKRLGQDNQKLQNLVKQEISMWKMVDQHEHVCEFFRLCEDHKKVRFNITPGLFGT